MRKLLLMIPVALSLAACQTQEQANVGTGAAAGAAIGALASNDGDKLEGAVIGGAAGALLGGAYNASQKRTCIYRYSDGTTYRAACP